MTTPDPNFNTTPNNSNPFAQPGSNHTPASNQGNFGPGYPGNNTGFGSNMSEPSNPFGPGVGEQPGQPARWVNPVNHNSPDTCHKLAPAILWLWSLSSFPGWAS